MMHQQQAAAATATAAAARKNTKVYLVWMIVLRDGMHYDQEVVCMTWRVFKRITYLPFLTVLVTLHAVPAALHAVPAALHAAAFCNL
jgi:hypothetical protein